MRFDSITIIRSYVMLLLILPYWSTIKSYDGLSGAQQHSRHSNSIINGYTHAGYAIFVK